MADESAAVFDFSRPNGFAAGARGDSFASKRGDSRRPIQGANSNFCGSGAELEE